MVIFSHISGGNSTISPFFSGGKFYYGKIIVNFRGWWWGEGWRMLLGGGGGKLLSDSNSISQDILSQMSDVIQSDVALYS